MNQHTAANGLYLSRGGNPITELRKVGKEICLYTEDPEVFRRFSSSKFLVKIVTYQNHRAEIYAHDLYFPGRQKAKIIKMLKKQPSVAGKTEFFR